jgi:hypothetical protein
MRYFTCLCVAIYICASVLHAMKPQNSEQLSPSGQNGFGENCPHASGTNQTNKDIVVDSFTRQSRHKQEFATDRFWKSWPPFKCWTFGYPRLTAAGW